MKRVLVFLGITFLGFTGVLAQMTFNSAYEIKQAVELLDFNRRHSGDISKFLTEENIDGSPYLNDEFIKGAIFTTSKTQYVDVPLRYNIYNDQIEFQLGENPVQALAAPETIELIQYGDYTFEYVPYTNAKKIRRGFFIVEEKGNATLYSKPQVIFENAKEPAAYQDAVPARFLKRPDEYYIRAGMELALLVSKKKDLEEVFPDHKEEISAFIQKNKVKPNNPETLKKLVKYYNSL
ncbi:MAG TPA: hypothetical protein ENN90_12135 [Mariniphaga anaerophila]|uniref:Uncharacterized protein n=1 Tax=Mariniphaga anaerophila TaxID=1484053 RepID=A0A831LXJ5_9BACT|nr:hypothetical protein [Mariniphaga anaerophila]